MDSANFTAEQMKLLQLNLPTDQLRDSSEPDSPTDTQQLFTQNGAPDEIPDRSDAPLNGSPRLTRDELDEMSAAVSESSSSPLNGSPRLTLHKLEYSPNVSTVSEILNTRPTVKADGGNAYDPIESLYCLQYYLCNSCTDVLLGCTKDVVFSGCDADISISLCAKCVDINKTLRNCYWTTVGRERRRYRDIAYEQVQKEQNTTKGCRMSI